MNLTDDRIQMIAFCTAFGLINLLTVLCGRKSFLWFNCVMMFAHGIGHIFFPKVMMAMSQMHGTPDISHLLAWQYLGIILIAFGLMYLFYIMKSTDERVINSLLSLSALFMLLECSLFMTFPAKFGKDFVAHSDKDGKVKGSGKKLLMNPESFVGVQVVTIMFFITTMIHYLRSPSLKPQAPAKYDTQMGVHRSILFGTCLVGGVQLLISPDFCVKNLFYPGVKLYMDSGIEMCYVLGGLLTICSGLFLRESAEFVNKEDQAIPFQVNIMSSIIGLGVFGYNVYVGHIPAKSLTILCSCLGIQMLNSTAAIFRARNLELDPKESKKRK